MAMHVKLKLRGGMFPDLRADGQAQKQIAQNQIDCVWTPSDTQGIVVG
jgi:hypothetical protein